MSKRTTQPHVLRLNDRVYQRQNPWHTGTVTKVHKDVSFTITYDDPDRRPGSPRVRYTYSWGMMSLFMVGKPIEVDPHNDLNPIPVNVEAFGHE